MKRSFRCFHEQQQRNRGTRQIAPVRPRTPSDRRRRGGLRHLPAKLAPKMPKRLPFGRKKNPGSHSDAVAGDSRPNSSRRTRTKTTPETTAIIVTATSGNVHLCHQNDHHRRSTAVATEKNAAVTGRVAAAAPGAKFVRVVRALLHWLPPHHAVAATVTATEPLGGQAVEEEDPVIKVEGGQPREREWAPRTALDFSGHSFAKSLQVHIYIYMYYIMCVRVR